MVLITKGCPGGDLTVLKDGNGEVQAGPYCILEESVEYCSRNREEKDDDDEDDDNDDDSDDDDVYQVFEEFDFSQLPDVSSIVSDDLLYSATGSLLHHHRRTPESPETLTFFKACCNNNVVIVKFMIRQGITEEEVREVDKNNRTGLIMACYHGYMDVVIALAKCPYVDVNWQDSEGNTALMVAAQAGHTVITNYLLNYFAGLDMERRNCHGFTALMKAAMQGQAACVRAIMMSGGDVESRDCGRRLTAREWALLTGHYETAQLMQRFTARPYAEQFRLSFCMEWPARHEQTGHTADPASCWRGLLASVCAPFALSLGEKPHEGGRWTTWCARPRYWPARSWPPPAALCVCTAHPVWASSAQLCHISCIRAARFWVTLHARLRCRTRGGLRLQRCVGAACGAACVVACGAACYIAGAGAACTRPRPHPSSTQATRPRPHPSSTQATWPRPCPSSAQATRPRPALPPHRPPGHAPALPRHRPPGHAPALPPHRPPGHAPALPPHRPPGHAPALPRHRPPGHAPALPPHRPPGHAPALPPHRPPGHAPALPPHRPPGHAPALPLHRPPGHGPALPPHRPPGHAPAPARLHLCQSAQTTRMPEKLECRPTDPHYLQVPSLKHDPLWEGRL